MADIRAEDPGDLGTRLVEPCAGPVATIQFDRADVEGRRRAVAGSFGNIGAAWEPYPKGNGRRGSNGFDTVAFNSFGSRQGERRYHAQRRWCRTGKLTGDVSVYGDASDLTAVSGELLIALKGNVGLRVTWRARGRSKALWPARTRISPDGHLSDVRLCPLYAGLLGSCGHEPVIAGPLGEATGETGLDSRRREMFSSRSVSAGLLLVVSDCDGRNKPRASRWIL